MNEASVAPRKTRSLAAMIEPDSIPGAGPPGSAPGSAGARAALVNLMLIPLLCGIATVVSAEDASTEELGRPLSVDEIALELKNPVSGLRNLVWDYEGFTHQGHLPGSEDQTGSRMVFTPSWPIELGNGKRLMLRATIPIEGDLPNWQPLDYIDYRDYMIRKVPEDEPRIDPANGEFGYGHDHLGDIALDFGYGGVNADGRLSLFNLAVVMPTSEDGSGKRNQWLLGPEFALGKMTDKSVYGFRAKHLTDISGEGEQELGKIATNETTLQLFYGYSLGNGWLIESNPVILYDWEAVSGNEWLVPVGAGASKTFRAGRRPMKLGLELQYYVVSPDRFGPEWLLRFSFTPLVYGQLFE